MSAIESGDEPLQDRQPVESEALVDGGRESVILVQVDGTRRAWLNVCPHAGRRLDYAPGKFLLSRDGLLVCAAHGASFDMATGVCVAGPCKGASLRAVDGGAG
ncbi:Rieske (2Fe-2S) protein [Lysobacter humi (ex Lee et al. 2017)]